MSEQKKQQYRGGPQKCEASDTFLAVDTLSELVNEFANIQCRLTSNEEIDQVGVETAIRELTGSYRLSSRLRAEIAGHFTTLDERYGGQPGSVAEWDLQDFESEESEEESEESEEESEDSEEESEECEENDREQQPKKASTLVKGLKKAPTKDKPTAEVTRKTQQQIEAATQTCKLLGMYVNQVLIQLTEFADEMYRAYDRSQGITMAGVLIGKAQALPPPSLACRGLEARSGNHPRNIPLRNADKDLQESHKDLTRLFVEFAKLEECLATLWAAMYKSASSHRSCESP